jgi:hypothetical protein
MNPGRNISILFTLAVFLLLPDILISRSKGFTDFEQCSAQCGGFTGSMKIKCIETCSRVSRREKSRESPNENFKKCDELCKSFKGINNVKCIRICLEKIKEREKKSGSGHGSGSVTPDDPCRSRCAVFNEPMKSNCFRRCRRENKPFKKRSVW